MSDGVIVGYPASTTFNIATDEVLRGSVTEHQQIMKLSLGQDGDTSILNIGQQPSISSLPVVIASDQGSLTVSGSLTVNNTVFSVTVLNPITSVTINNNQFTVTCQPHSVTVLNPVTSITVNNTQFSVTVQNQVTSVTVNNTVFSTTVLNQISISGSVTVLNPVSSVTVNNSQFTVTGSVTINNSQFTVTCQPHSVTVSNASVTISGSVTINNPSAAAEIPDYSVRVFENATYIYVGQATPGSSTSSSVWKIKRITAATGDTYYADGNSNFDNIWSDYLTLTYS